MGMKTTITHFPHGAKTNHPYTKRGNEAYCYTVGHKPPNYSVPAIRESFEFGRQLPCGSVVLIHMKQGRYEG